MVGKVPCYFKERLEARQRFSWEQELVSGELYILTIVCSTEQSMGLFKGTDYVDFKSLKILLLKILNEM